MSDQFDLSGLSAEELEEFIQRAAKLRAATEPYPRIDAPEAADAVVNPAWYTMLGEGGTLLQIRHPGIGWLSFVIPPAERAHLLSLLLQQALVDRAPGLAPVAVGRTKGSSGRVH